MEWLLGLVDSYWSNGVGNGGCNLCGATLKDVEYVTGGLWAKRERGLFTGPGDRRSLDLAPLVVLCRPPAGAERPRRRLRTFVTKMRPCDSPAAPIFHPDQDPFATQCRLVCLPDSAQRCLPRAFLWRSDRYEPPTDVPEGTIYFRYNKFEQNARVATFMLPAAVILAIFGGQM
jgi:hypothetical protein